MNRVKNILAVVGFVGLLVLFFGGLWMIGENSPVSKVEARVVDPETPDAFGLAELIQTNVQNFRILDEEARPLREQRDELQRQIDEIEGRMEKYATGAEGLDYTLCNQYGVKYVRGDVEFGHFIEAEECESF